MNTKINRVLMRKFDDETLDAYDKVNDYRMKLWNKINNEGLTIDEAIAEIEKENNEQEA